MTAPEPTDWSLAPFEGLRRAQHEAFRALSFREKLLRLEEMDEVATQLAAQVPVHVLAPVPPQPPPPGSQWQHLICGVSARSQRADELFEHIKVRGFKPRTQTETHLLGETPHLGNQPAQNALAKIIAVGSANRGLELPSPACPAGSSKTP